MKKIIKKMFVTLVILSLLVVAPFNIVKAQISASISLQTFYDELDPYGQWVQDPDYGYVWIADAGPGFRPYYTRGHWVMTSYGAMWVSDYSWGWAPFHYGRWAYSSYYGWVWIPDTEWGPAWVSWRSGGESYGWAPLGPGINVSITLGRGYNVPNEWWVFVPSRYCFSSNFNNYRIAPERNVTYVNNTTIVNNTYVNNNVTYAAGPGIRDVEKATGKKIPVYSVADNSRSGKTAVQGNEVKTFRPKVAKTGGKPADAISRDQYIKNKGQRNDVAPKNDQPTQRIQQNKQQPQVERKQPSQVERKQQPQMERKQQPQVERKQQPQVERKQQPQIERKQQPQVERQQQPQVERKQQPQVETKQQPQVERKQQPQIERKQQPQVERKQQPQMERKQQPAREPKKSNPPVNKKGNNK
jgi:hypothetical protein